MAFDYDVAVVGGGPAGMTAAIYTARAGLKTVVFEAAAVGGQIINSVDVANYPAAPHISGFQFAENLRAQAEEMGVEIKLDKVDKIEKSGIIRGKKGSFCARAIILATGAGHRKLGLKNENELVGRGVSYCATCDGGFFRGKKVAVVGGGDTALDDALYLANLAEKVYLIHRREEFRGSGGTVRKLERCKNVEFVLNSVVTELIAEDGKLTGIKVADKARKEPRKERKLEVAGLFVAIGQGPATGEFTDLVELDEAGYVVAGEDGRTAVPGIFVAGDVRAKTTRQLATAVGDGAAVADAVVEYLHS